MGLIRGVARTAVVAGTATAVSNRVSRRQAARWAEPDARAYQEPTYQQVPYQQQAYPAPPPAAPTAAMDDSEVIAQLKKWGELKAQGVITEEEFAAQKARLLGS